MTIVWFFGRSENRVISNEIYAQREPLSHTLSSSSRLVILVKKKAVNWRAELSIKGLMILMLKCKWSRLECFEICKERLWHCHYCVITVGPHGSHCKGWGGDGEPISKSQGLFLQTWDTRKKPDSISEDLRMLGDDKWRMLTLKNAQCENCKLSFIWGKMRTAAWETAPQIALRNSSKETRGKVSIYDLHAIWNTMQSEVQLEYMQSGPRKKIKTSKASGLEKEDNDLKGSCRTTWLRGWQNWTLSPTPILRADCISLGPSTPVPGPLGPVHLQTVISAKDYPEQPSLTKSSSIASPKLPLKYEASFISRISFISLLHILHALSLVTVAPPCLNKSNLSP